MIRGIVYVVLACFIWSSIFVIPSLLQEFDSFEVAMGRYFFYGVISLLLLAWGRFKLLWEVDKNLWMKAIWLGIAGNIIYYFVLVVCMRFSGAAISALMLGMSPITVAWYGSWKNRESYKSLILPSLATFLGLVLVNLPAWQESADHGSILRYCVGLLAGFLALGLWTWYAVMSKIVLTRYPNVSASDWSTILGTATMFSLIVVLGGWLALNWNSSQLILFSRWSNELKTFLLGTAFLGIPCSWIGFYFWSKGSCLLPVGLSGQLLICETLFGLCLVHYWEDRLPSPIEWLGMVFMLTGILASLILINREKSKAAQIIHDH